ncbi:hypothetical protein PATSB16_03110 [Pandoraea thiooxydans]|nr:hypothetical protein PATSB16_03110 [Pandoraea thiooxydans]
MQGTKVHTNSSSLVKLPNRNMQDDAYSLNSGLLALCANEC